MKFFTKSKQLKTLLITVTITLLAINLSIQLNLKETKSNTTAKTSDKKEAVSSATTTTAESTQNGAPIAKNYEQIWKTLFISGEKRPGSMCVTPLNIDYKPVKKPNIPPSRESFLPKKKPNVFYNKPGYEDAAYFWDYLDNIFQKKIAKDLKKHWQAAKAAPPNPKVADPYSVKEQVIYYYNNGGRYQVYYDPHKETDPKKLGGTLHFFNDNINPEIMEGGIKIPQMEAIFKMFGISFNPGIIGWEKKKVDFYDFNGDGSLSAEEFLFLLIWENKTRLSDPRLFKGLCESLLDPMFDYMDCDSDGNIQAEGLWVGIKEMIRPTTECDIYACLSPKTKLPVRTGAPGDVVLKNAEEAQGQLTRDEWRKAVLLAYWDRQVNNNSIFDGDEENQKDMRWFNRMFDKNCYDGNGVR